MRKSIKKSSIGFTLIELLVTIALLGILAGGILIALNITGTVGKASLTKTKQFAAQLERGLVISQVGKWSFEEVDASNITPDTSGYGNSGTVSDVAMWKPPTDPACNELGLGACLSFDGNDYVTAVDSSSLTITDAITVSLWVNINSVSNDWTYIIQKGTKWRIESKVDGNLYWTTETSGGGYVWYTNTLWTAKQWHHLVATYNSSTGMLNFYKDGIKTNEANHTGGGSLLTSTDPVRFGGNDTSKMVNGLIDEVQIYNQPLTLSQIQYVYGQGLVRRAVAFR